MYLVLGDLPEQPDHRDTADGRPATRACAHARLARMLCADLESSTETERLELVSRIAARQTNLLASAIQKVQARLPTPPETVILAGSGAFLADAPGDKQGERKRCGSSGWRRNWARSGPRSSCPRLERVGGVARRLAVWRLSLAASSRKGRV